MNQTFIDCGLVDLLTGKTALVVGLEDEPDGALRVYVGARYWNVYVVIEPDATEAQQAIRDGWASGGHVLIPLPPPDALQQCPVTSDRGPLGA